jgi:hypothetical protein
MVSVSVTSIVASELTSANGGLAIGDDQMASHQGILFSLSRTEARLSIV